MTVAYPAGDVGLARDEPTIYTDIRALVDAINAPISKSTYIYAAPLTGATVTILDTQDRAVIEPAGTIAALTVVLPTASAAYDGKVVNICSTQIVTTLTLSATAGTIVGGGTAMAVGVGQDYVCRGSTAKWYRCR